jgi:hypothetical protein
MDGSGTTCATFTVLVLVAMFTFCFSEYFLSEDINHTTSSGSRPAKMTQARKAPAARLVYIPRCVLHYGCPRKQCMHALSSSCHHHHSPKLSLLFARISQIPPYSIAENSLSTPLYTPQYDETRESQMEVRDLQHPMRLRRGILAFSSMQWGH